MNQINYCELLIKTLIEIYMEEKKFIYSICDDLVSDAIGLDSEEVTKLIYPSIMYLSDFVAKSHGFPSSEIEYSLSENPYMGPFKLMAKNYPKNLTFILPIVSDVCDTYLAQNNVLENIYSEVLNRMDAVYDSKLQNSYNSSYKF